MVGIKNNRRARYTKKMIQETVLDLLEDNPINNITVTEVCKKADVNRTTFYRYYEDIYQCVDDIEMEFLESNEPPEKIQPVSAIEGLLTAFYNEKKLSNLVFVEGKTRLLEKLQDAMDQNGKEFINQYQSAYLMAGMQSIMKIWVKNGMKETPHELTKIIIKIVFADNLQPMRKFLTSGSKE
ncbi:TetR/AcrR family transcriptional regulator [Companilactobacillus baiquanensis]|uniref:TetR/AcrR family transcriptional regulator n=1 Tax=Companilactobacillus baiquanensis TaxID=2486005 RepID=A0ABW1UW08_9LACO|nr:TetR/AcrR family transcriptional regulator [Companilactobacillus baiquanensis]